MGKKLTVFCYRTPDDRHQEPYYCKYEVEISGPTSALNVLREIFRHADQSLAFLDHAACGQGACSRCTIKINGKNRLACLADLREESIVYLEPASRRRAWKDLFCG